ncbi:purine-nucleoside phosphorylase [Ruminococcaceae bacterium R-25]|nr:purine-nucleoside phosphorylase [Ruminococcaceae bacterium R-25]SUQ11441.1 purine-nucleoside phosphorylase [Oscillospiraceae bacterium]
MITDIDEFIKRVDGAADYIRSVLSGKEIPSICIVLGSGLGPLSKMAEDALEIPYKDIPGFPVSTAPGHKGSLIVGKLSDKPVFMMNGRFHYYEGYPMETVTFYVRVMGRLGVKVLLLTNASGGINIEMKVPELVAVTDHISFHAEPVLRGPNIEEFGTRFPDQCHVYDPELTDTLVNSARDLNIRISRGVYAYSKGPQYETPAEIRALRILGADCVGMSTVPEAIAASHMGIRVAAMSCITNMAAGISGNPLSEQEVLDNAALASDNSCALVKEFVNRIKV